MNLDARSRVAAAIRRQPVDRIPTGELCIDDALVAAMLGTPDVAFPHRLEMADRLGLDLVCLAADYGPAGERGALPAAGSVLWEDISRWAGETERFVFVLLDGGFAWGVRKWGFEAFLTLVLRGSPEVAAGVERVEALNRRLVERAADLGANGVVIGDDIAFHRGLFLPPDRMRELFLPSLSRQAACCRAAGLPVFFHSDGDLRGILADIADTGVDGLQGIESAAGMDLAAVQAAYGRRLCLWGNLDSVCLTAALPREAVEERVEAVLALGRRRTGLIFGTSSGLFEGMRVQNVRWAYRAARRATVQSVG